MAKDKSSRGKSAPAPAMGKKQKAGCTFSKNMPGPGGVTPSAKGRKASEKNMKKTQSKLTAGASVRRGNEGVSTSTKL